MFARLTQKMNKRLHNHVNKAKLRLLRFEMDQRTDGLTDHVIGMPERIQKLTRMHLLAVYQPCLL